MINGDGDVSFALPAGRVKIYLFNICNGGRPIVARLHKVIVEWRGVACVGQRAGGRLSQQPISRDSGLVGVH